MFGGYAAWTYLAENADLLDEKRYVVKIPRLDTREHYLPEVDEYIGKLTRLLIGESDLSVRLAPHSHVVALLEDYGQFSMSVVFHRDNTVAERPMSFAVYPYVAGKDLVKWCKGTHLDKAGEFSGIKDIRLWLCLVKQILAVVDTFHTERVVHGDIWPPNIMIVHDEGTSVPRVVFIDLGQAWKVDDHFYMESQDRTQHEYMAPERIQGESADNWWFTKADMYSVGGVLYYLAVGSPPAFPWQDEFRNSYKSNEDIKAEIKAALEQNNRALLNENRGIVDIILQCLRPGKDRAAYAGQVLDTIEGFFDDGSSAVLGSNGIQAIKTALSQLTSCFKQLEERGKDEDAKGGVPFTINPIFQKIVLRSIRNLEDDIKPLASRVYSQIADREALLNSLVGSIALLQDGDTCTALTSPAFWHDGNFGPEGRLSTAITMATLRGVAFKWCLVCPKIFQKLRNPAKLEKALKPDWKVLTCQKRVACEVAQLLATRGVDEGDIRSRYSFKLYFATTPQIAQFRQTRQTFVMLSRKVEGRSQQTLVAPDYHLAGGKINALRFWANPTRDRQLLQFFAEYEKDGQHILNWNY
jgi:serine/threonine protein kinase